MSQQINLLPRAPAAPKISAARCALLLLLLAIALGIYGEWQKMQADHFEQLVVRSEQLLQGQKAIVQTLQRKLGEPPGNLATQIAALEPQTRVSKDILERLKNGDLGSLDGYGEQLTRLAAMPAPGIWVTSVTISNAGRSMRVEGRALQKNQVLDYARGLNASMKKYDARFSEVEIVPMPQESAFAFKLH